MSRGARRALRVAAAGVMVFASWSLDAHASSLPGGATPFEIQLVPPAPASPRAARAWERDGILYLSANDISELVDARKFWRSELGRLTLVVGDREIRVTAGTDLAVVDGTKLVHLPGPVFFWEGRVMVPLDLVVDEAGNSQPWIKAPVSFSRKDRRLEVDADKVSVSAATITRERAGWTLAIEADAPIRVELLERRRSSFVLRFPDLTYDPLLHPLPSEHRWFQNLRVRNVPQGLEVSFAPGPSAVGYRVEHRPRNRVELFLGLDERELREGKLRPLASVSSTQRAPLALVALDPGHGGGKRGAKVNGGWEDELAWKICMAVAQGLTRELGVDVVLTREENEGPSDLGRAETANRVDAGFLVSVHLHNRPGGPRAYVADMKDTGNAPSATLASMGFRPFGAGQLSYLTQSRAAAREVLDAVAGNLGGDDLGVVAEPLAQLGAAAMPAVLLELGSGEKKKWTRGRLDAVADGIVEGIRRYLIVGEIER